MAVNDSLIDVVNRLDSGDEQAANEIFSRFGNRLIGLARTRMDPKIRQKVDPEDVIQSVFRSFFVRQEKGQFEFANWGGMWGLLVQLTLRKCGRKAENLRAACRDLRREVNPSDSSESSNNSWEAATRDPTPEEIVSLAETMQNLFSHLDEVECEILELKLQNYKNTEITKKIGRSERKVYRVLDKIKEHLQESVA